MKKLICAILVAAACSAAVAAELDIDIGITHFTEQADGFWRQDGFAHYEHLTSPTISFKLFTDPDLLGLQYGIGYDWVGEASSSAMVVPLDSNYSATSPTHCNGPCEPLGHMIGEGHIFGGFLAVRDSFKDPFKLTLSGKWVAEIDLYALRATWDTTNQDWRMTSSQTPVVSILNHDPKYQIGVGAAVGYNMGGWTWMLKITPSHVSNTQAYTDPGTGAKSTIYVPGIYKAVSPSFVIQRAFNIF